MNFIFDKEREVLWLNGPVEFTQELRVGEFKNFRVLANFDVGWAVLASVKLLHFIGILLLGPHSSRR